MTGGIITGVSVSHQRADLDTLEQADIEEETATVGRLLDGPAREAFALRTCNRAEAYVVTDTATEGRAALAGVVGDVPPDSVRWLTHEEALEHLLRIAAGVESLVVGEDQILGQVRDAFENARTAGGIGPMLEEGVTKAIRVGERTRSETPINEGVVSLGSAAVELAERHRELGDATALVVGAGEMGTLAARSLAPRVERLVVANRTRGRAERLAADIDDGSDVAAIGLGALPAALAAADVAVSATGSPETLVDRDTLATAGETFVVDIARPRDVAPAAADLPGTVVRDLDDLEAVTEATERRREAAVEQAEAIVEEELERLLQQYKRKRADEVIAAMYESAERVKSEEIDTALGRLEATGEVTDEQREVVESLADALVGQLLAPPTRSLRDAAEEDDWSTINTALELFDPDFRSGADRRPASEVDPDDLPENLDPEEIPEPVRADLPDAVLSRLADD
jgi:glutamyl-tRNA reductase